MTNDDHYARAGVNIEAGQRAVDLMRAAIRATYSDAVLSDTGHFGGLYAAHGLSAMRDPVLVASTDGVGTKTKVAARMGTWETIGQDLVNHCINDILVQGARPLFFLDYVASDKLVPEQIASIVGGMAQACQAAGCALLGGETAEMPGVYAAGEVDVVGTIIGVVERDAILDGQRIDANDAILGLTSSGLHTNGYTLARSVLADLDWSAQHEALGTSIGAALLAVHRSYLPHIDRLRAADVALRGLAHITGGGLVANLPRILPQGIGAVLHPSVWEVPPVFRLIQQTGGISDDEMRRVFNMGLGMLVVVPNEQTNLVLDVLPDDAVLVGHMEAGPQIVRFEEV